MTVQQLINELQKLPQSAQVAVLINDKIDFIQDVELSVHNKNVVEIYTESN
jgi:thiamine monophosphate synthase